jgi:pimeloyl-ACP methyl ester carboxylesterase
MIHAERYGSGADVYVGVHGWGGSHKTFAPLMPHLPRRASFQAIDLPGYGRSPWQPVDGVIGIAAQLAAFIETASPGPVTVVGNCSGAILGLLAYDLIPDRIDRFVLIDPFAFLPWYFKVFVNRWYGRTAYRSTFANPLGRWLTNLSLKQRRQADTDLTRSFQAVDHEVSLRYLELLDALDGIEPFRSVSVPIEIAYGARTFAAVKRSVLMWQELWPHARVWPLDGAGHLPIEEVPAEVARIAFDDTHRVAVAS